MSEIEALLFAVCVMPVITCLVCIFACELRIQHREADTRRYPRYGRSTDMPDDTEHGLKIKSRFKDNET